jgi:hypothetical protein
MALPRLFHEMERSKPGLGFGGTRPGLKCISEEAAGQGNCLGARTAIEPLLPKLLLSLRVDQ